MNEMNEKFHINPTLNPDTNFDFDVNSAIMVLRRTIPQTTIHKLNPDPNLDPDPGPGPDTNPDLKPSLKPILTITITKIQQLSLSKRSFPTLK